MKGSISTYNSKGSLVFKNEIESSKTIVFLDGLDGNILSNAYISKLNEFCISKNISLVIPQLRSMPNYRIAPIDFDIEDIKSVLRTVKGEIVLMGHSTGCNDILLYLESHSNLAIKGVILQAPVSDTESSDEQAVKVKLKLIEDSNPNELYIELPQIGLWRKERYISLYKKYGKEDVFSSYLDDSMFSKWIKKIKILAVLSGSDEYAKKDMKNKFSLMGKVCEIEDADHSISNKELQNILIEEIDKFFYEINF